MVKEQVTFDLAMDHMKKVVYKNRIRIKEFIVDFDKLHSGYVHCNHFTSALSMASLDKFLTAAELEVISEAYKVPRTPSLVMVDYKTFLSDMDTIFTLPNLEKTPTVDVAEEPHELLDKTRYMKSSKALPPDEEEALQKVIQRLTDIVARRGTPVKPFFDDSAANDHSAKLYGHVTIPQFRQCLSTKLELFITEEEAKLIVAKYANEEKPELINYIAFSNTIDDPVKYWTQ